eukprot:scaffold3836_cov125-Isochrysis_galbana.AAC.6
MPHKALRESAARVSARIPSAARSRVIRHERLGGGALGDRAVGVGALHHVRKHEQVMRLRLNATAVQPSQRAM